MKIGVLSDTHGLLRNELYAAFEGVDRIVHAGDVGEPAILTELEVVAPVTAVPGNVDGWEVANRWPEVAELELEGRRVTVVHGHQWGSPSVQDLLTAHPGSDVIIYGHTHQALCERHGGVLVLNPGSAGPQRFGKPATAAILTLGRDARPEARILTLAPRSAGSRRG